MLCWVVWVNFASSHFLARVRELVDVRGVVRRPAKSIISNLPAIMCLVTQLCPTLCDPVDCSLPGFSVHGDSPGKKTGMVYHALLQGIFLTQDGTQVSHVAGGFFTV